MIWTPSQEFIETTNVWRLMRRLGFEDREEFLLFSRENPERFWAEMMREMRVSWSTPYETVMDISPRAGVVAVVHGRAVEHRGELSGPVGGERSYGVHLGGGERADADA